MATRPHATSEEQKAALGKIRRRPRYVDMFSGEINETLPKRGNGSHVALKPVGIERPAVPGMASWAGGGPEGKRCRDCAHLGGVVIQRPSGDIERVSAACLRYCQRLGRLPVVRRDLTLERACDQFEEGQSGKFWLIDWEGATHAPDWIDHNGVGRFYYLREHEDALRPGHMAASR